MIFDLAIGVLLAFVVMMLRRTQMPSQFRSVIAVMFGFFAMALMISFCTIAFSTMHITTAERPAAFFAGSAAYAVVAALLGGWVAGDIAPVPHQLWHGVALAVVIVLLSLRGILHPAPAVPAWYTLLLAVVPPLTAIAGAALAPRRLRI